MSREIGASLLFAPALRQSLEEDLPTAKMVKSVLSRSVPGFLSHKERT